MVREIHDLNGGVSFRWLFGPLFVWGSKESTIILTTHLSLVWWIHHSSKIIDLGLDAIKSFFAEDHWKRDKAVDIELDRNIKIGATTNSFSIEGGWDQDGKGISIWDQWVNQEHLHMGLLTGSY